MSVDIVVGGQFGDEGKGKIVSYLTVKDNIDHVIRAGVGANAGHEVVLDGGTSYVMTNVPAGFVNPTTKLYISAGAIISVNALLYEIELLHLQDRILIDEQCGIVERKHVLAEKRNKTLSKTGSTKCGTTASNSDRAFRKLRLAKDEERLKPYLADVSLSIEKALNKGQKVLIEGTQGVGLSLFHGRYPFVTSKDVTAPSLLADVGLSFRWVNNVYLVCRPFPVRIAEGPLYGEMNQSEIDEKQLWEYSEHMERTKRVGKFDFSLLKQAVRLNGANIVALTHVDKINRSAYGCREKSMLPKNVFTEFVDPIESSSGIAVKLISTSPRISDVVDLREKC